MPDPDFTTEHVSGEYWLMHQYGDWLPMRKTRTGNLAFLTGPGYKADGTRERALEIIYQHQREDKEYEEHHPRDAARLKRMGRSRHERNPETRSDAQVLPGGWRLYQKDSGFWFASHSGFEHGPFTSERSASQHIANLQRENPGKLTFGQSPFDQVPGERKRYHVTDDRGFIVAKFDHGYIAAEEAQDMSEKHSGVTYSVVDTRNGQVHDRFRDGQELKGNPGKGWFTRCMEGVSASGSAYDPGAVCGAELKKMGYSRRGRRNPGMPAKSSSSWGYYGIGGYSWGSDIGQYTIVPVSKSGSRGRRTVYELHSPAGLRGRAYSEHKTLSAAISQARKNYKTVTGRSSNPRAPQNKVSPFGARQILAQIAGNLDTDFHTLSSSQVSDLLEEADKVGYRKSKSAPGSRGRMFYQYLQRVASRLEKNTRRRTRNAGLRSVRKTKKFLKKLTRTAHPLSRSRSATKGWGVPYTRMRKRTNPTKRYQIRAAGRIFTVSAKTKSAAQAEVAKYCRQHGLVVRNPKHIRPSDFSYLWTASQKNELTRLADEARITLSLAVEKSGTDFKKLRTWLRKRAVGYRPVRRRNRKKSVSMLVPRSTRRTIRATERRTSKALSRYLGGSR